MFAAPFRMIQTAARDQRVAHAPSGGERRSVPNVARSPVAATSAGPPGEVLQVPAQLAGGAELAGDEVAPQAAADVLELRRLAAVGALAAAAVVEHADQVADVVLDRARH